MKEDRELNRRKQLNEMFNQHWMIDKDLNCIYKSYGWKVNLSSKVASLFTELLKTVKKQIES